MTRLDAREEHIERQTFALAVVVSREHDTGSNVNWITKEKLCIHLLNNIA